MAHARPAFPPALGVAVAVASVSFAAPLFRLADAPPLTASFWRLALAVAMLLPFAGPAAWRSWRGYGGADWAVTAAAGVALALHFALWVTSLFMTTVAAATVLVTLQAVFVALGGHFVLRDRLGAAGWAGVLVAVLGGAVVAWGDVEGDPAPGFSGATALLGDLLALVAGLGSAAYMLIGRRLRQGRGLVEYVLPVYAIAALALMAAMPLLGQPLLRFDAASAAAPQLGPHAAFVVFVLLAAIPMLGGHTVSNWVLRHLPAHTMATWILLEPVGAAILAWPLLGEVPGAATVAGGLLVLAGAFMTVPRPPRRAPAEPVAR